jgi:hypothetical protein
MVFGLKNGLTFESQYILSTMNESTSSGNTDSLPIRLNINAFENTQSSDGNQVNQLPDKHQTPLINSNLRTPMRVQVEYPDSISRKRKHQVSNHFQQPLKKMNSVNSMTIIEQFREECLEDDVLLSQVADVHVNDEPIEIDSDGHLSLGLSDTARVFARCFSLPIEESAKKGKVLVYDSDGLVDDSD